MNNKFGNWMAAQGSIETKDLMLNDWIDVLGTKARVSSLNDGGFYKAKADGVELQLTSDYLEYSAKPVPVTEEILALNGFEPVDGDSAKWFPGVSKAYRHPDWTIQISYNGMIGKYMIFDDWVTFEYVHELQRAFRSVQLRELADGFKIG